MTEVDKIYPQFYSLLKEAFPNLTESEYQYCYLHIFGFDANDEAKLLGINPDSIRMKRTRIKQKLEKQVDEGISLRDYLNPEKPDVPLNKNDAFQKVQKRRVQEKR